MGNTTQNIMNLKRMLSGTMATLICVMSIAWDMPNKGIGFQKKEEEGRSNSPNSLANYIENMSDQNNPSQKVSAEEINFFCIQNVQYHEDQSILEVNSSQAMSCNIQVSLLEDNEERNVIRTTKTPVNAGESIISNITIDQNDIPEYFVIKVELVDLPALQQCPPFYLNVQTQAIQNIINSDINDFDPKYVINFDESEDTNFIVLDEETVYAHTTETTNNLVSADYDNGEFIFKNTDDKINNLKQGDYFYIQPDENNIIAINVESVKEDDGKVIIKDSCTDIDKMFSFIKIDSITDNQFSTNSQDNVENRQEYDTTSTDDINTSSNTSFPMSGFNFKNTSLDRLAEDKTDNNINPNVKNTPGNDIPSNPWTFSNGFNFEVGESPAKLQFEGTIESQFSFYKNKEIFEVMFSNTVSFSVSVSLTIEPKKTGIINDPFYNREIGEFKIPIPGIPACYVHFKPQIVLKCSGGFTLSYTNSFTSGFIFNNDGLSQIRDPGHISSNNIELNGELEFGISLNIGLEFINKDFLTIDLVPFIGVSLTASEKAASSDKYFDNKLFKDKNVAKINCQTSDTLHLCDSCFDIVFNFVGKLDLEINILHNTVVFTGNIFEAKYKLFDYHCSSEAGVSNNGFGKCQNYAYKITLCIADEEDKKLFEGGTMTIDDASVPITNGTATLYARSGLYTVTITNSEQNESHCASLFVNNSARSITYPDHFSKVQPDTPVTTPAVTTTVEPIYEPVVATPNKEYEIIESGKLGDHIGYSLYRNGFLHIYGSGQMTDFSGAPITNGSLVKEVLIENQNVTTYDTDEDGNIVEKTLTEGITNIGAYVLSGLNNSALTSIAIPDSITSIGDCAFYNCSALNVMPINSGITSIGYGAFKGCSSIKQIIIPDSVTLLGPSAFEECSALTEATLGQGLTSVSDNVGFNLFKGCYNLKKLTMPSLGTKSPYFSGWSIYPRRYIIDLFDNSLKIDPQDTENTNKSFSQSGYSLTDVVISSGDSITEYAYAGMDTIEEVILSDTIETIGPYAFYNCTNLNKINIDTNITTLSDGAFKNCSNICDPEFSPSLVSIGNSTFYNCDGIKSIQIPASTTSIGDSAFAYCDNIEKINIPDNIVFIGPSAFEECSALTGATLGQGLTSVSDNVGFNLFKGCYNLKKLTMPSLQTQSPYDSGWSYYPRRYIIDLFDNSLKIDPEDTENTSKSFSQSGYSLTDVVISSGDSITEYAYAGMDTIEKVILSDTIETIGPYAFYNCTNLNKINIDTHITTLSDGAFKNCSNICDPEFSPSLVSIGNSAFYNCDGIKSIKIPASTTSIGDNAFAYCDNIQKINIPDNIVFIGSSAFEECSALTEATLGQGLTSVSDNVGFNLFKGCYNLKKLTMPSLQTQSPYDSGWSYYPRRYIIDLFDNSLKIDSEDTENTNKSFSQSGYSLTDVVISSGDSITEYAYAGMDTIEKVILSDTIETIGPYAFYNCTNLNKINIDTHVTTLSDGAFKNCSNICGLEFFPSLVSIGNSVFYNCDGIESIQIPASTTSIGDNAFAYCDNIQKINIPDNIVFIGSSAFEECSALTEATLGQGLTSVSDNVGFNLFKGCYNLKKLTMPSLQTQSPYDSGWNYYPRRYIIDLFDNSLKIDPEDTENTSKSFSQSGYSLENIILSSGAYIYEFEFAGMYALKEIHIPNSINQISGDAFIYCTNLTDIYYSGSEDDWNKIIFRGDLQLPPNVCFHFNAIDKPEPPDPELRRGCGDINNDGTTNTADLLCLSFILFGHYEVTEEGYIYGDMNKDKKLDIVDMIILKHVLIGEKL